MFIKTRIVVYKKQQFIVTINTDFNYFLYKGL